MKISWNNGYRSSPCLQDIPTGEGQCNRHAALGDTLPRKVAVINASDGEYDSVQLCHECLVDLANELLEVK